MKQLITVSLLFLFSYSYSQDYSQYTHQELVDATTGIYQVQMINNRLNPAISDAHLVEVLSRQEESNTVYYQVSDKVRIKILPKNMTDQGLVVDDSELIVYITQ
jgi:hypothetical protein